MPTSASKVQLEDPIKFHKLPMCCKLKRSAPLATWLLPASPRPGSHSSQLLLGVVSIMLNSSLVYMNSDLVVIAVAQPKTCVCE